MVSEDGFWATVGGSGSISPEVWQVRGHLFDWPWGRAADWLSVGRGVEAPVQPPAIYVIDLGDGGGGGAEFNGDATSAAAGGAGDEGDLTAQRLRLVDGHEQTGG